MKRAGSPGPLHAKKVKVRKVKPGAAKAARWMALVKAGGLLAVATLGWTLLPLPAEVAHPAGVPGLRLEDRYGVPLRRLRAPDGARGGWVPIERVDPKIIQAFVAIEDHRFFDHHGVDWTSVGRALRDNLASGGVRSGASTLTMQTARLLRGMNRGWSGKVGQALWAIRLENHLSKAEILEIYLNHVPMGQGAVGVAAASELYFGTSPTRVSLGQAAMLAGIVRRPSTTNPVTAREHAVEGRAEVLHRMTALGLSDPAAAARASVEPVGVEPFRYAFHAPHFTTRLLADRGLAGRRGGVRTTLDLDLQQAVEAEVRHAVLNLKDAGAEHAAAVVLDNRSGDVLAWVGSPDFFADSVGQVDMVTSLRQPGSTLKPFLYGLALDRGYTAATVLPDVPRTYVTPTGPYSPRNYDRDFRGPVRIREALASSYNVPAVEITEQIGAASMLGVLRAAGFMSLNQDAEYYGLGLALGNGEVTLVELANAYRGLANGGVHGPVRRLLDGPPGGIRGRDLGFAGMSAGPPAARGATPGVQVGGRFLSESSAALLLDILSDPVARIGGFGTGTVLEFPFPVAAKTGTSRHFTDNWAVGTSQTTTVAVWVGNFSGRPMESVSGITGAGPLLRRVVLEAAERYPPGTLPPPGAVGAEPAEICMLSGLRAHAGCASMLEWFAPGTAPTRVDDWQQGGSTALPAVYAEWSAGREGPADRQSKDARHPDGRAEPAETESIARRILSPRQGDIYDVPPSIEARYATVPLVASGEGAAWFVDGEPHADSRWTIEVGDHTIVARWPTGLADSVRVSVH